MIFHASTTLRHQNNIHSLSFREKREINFIQGPINTVKNFGKGVKYVGTNIIDSKPSRGLFKPLIEGWKVHKEGGKKAGDLGLHAGMYAQEGGKAIVHPTNKSALRTAYEFTIIPVAKTLKSLFVDNTRHVIKNVFKTPYSLGESAVKTVGKGIKALWPPNIWKGIKNTISGTRSSVEGVFNDITDLRFGKLFKEGRAKIKNLLTKPAKAAWEHKSLDLIKDGVNDLALKPLKAHTTEMIEGTIRESKGVIERIENLPSAALAAKEKFYAKRDEKKEVIKQRKEARKKAYQGGGS